MNYAARIMNLVTISDESCGTVPYGYHITRHEAVAIVAEADVRIAELEAIITGASAEDRNRLLAHLLRWPVAERERLALHLLGDEAQERAAGQEKTRCVCVVLGLNLEEGA